MTEQHPCDICKTPTENVYLFGIMRVTKQHDNVMAMPGDATTQYEPVALVRKYCCGSCSKQSRKDSLKKGL